MKKTVALSITAFLFVAILFGTHSSASAAAQILTVTPSAVKPVIDPGATKAGSFQIINQGDTAYAVQIYAAPYSVHGEAYTPDFAPIPGRPDVASWLHFSESQSSIKSNETLTVHYTISVPAGTQPGGYYAVAFAHTQSSKATQGVVVNERVGELFYIQVAGPVKQAGKLLTWSSSFLQRPPVAGSLRLENDGGTDYASTVHVVVSDLFGNPKYTLNTQKVILPQTIRSIPISWKQAPALGLFKVSGTATILDKTQTLSTHYVLVASPTVRLVALGMAAMLLAFGTGRFLYQRKHRPKQPKTPSA